MTTAPTALPNTYREKFAQEQDPLEGNYGAFMQRFGPAATETPAEIHGHVLRANSALAKIFLTLVKEGGQNWVIAAHRPTMFTSSLVEPSPWDGNALAFVTDVHPASRQIELAHFSAEAFELTGEVVVPTIAEMDVRVGNLGAPAILAACRDGDPDTEKVQTRQTMAVPQPYAHLVLGQRMHPTNVWTELVGAIRADRREAELEPLVNWVRVACVGVIGATRASNDLPPANLAGTLGTDIYAPIRVGPLLQEHRWGVLCQDFPHWVGPVVDPGDRFLTALTAMNADQARRDRERQAERASAAGPATPQQKFPHAFPRFLRVAGGTTEEDLPPIYADLARASKAELRLALQASVDARALEPGAATSLPPIITKELVDMVKTGALGAHPMERDDLTKGLHPFTCGFARGARDEAVRIRVEDYDSSLAGTVQATLAEQAAFRTKEVPLPTQTWHAAQMLRGTSILLDVVQGVNHPHAVEYRRFVAEDWAEIQQTVDMSTEADQAYIGNVLPLVLREVQLRMVGYFRKTLAAALGQGTPPPNYADITTAIALRHFQALAPIPPAYRAQPRPGGGESAGESGSHDGGRCPGGRSTGGGGGGPNRGRTGGATLARLSKTPRLCARGPPPSKPRGETSRMCVTTRQTLRTGSLFAWPTTSGDPATPTARVLPVMSTWQALRAAP